MKTLIAANWKMNGDLSWTAKPAQFAAEMENCDSALSDKIETIICPPQYMLSPTAQAAGVVETAFTIQIGAQDCHFEEQGAFTGEMSAQMVRDAGANYTIIGHSERRAMFGDTDEVVAKKLRAAQSVGLTAILCVGESKEIREQGQADEVVGAQLLAALGANVGESSVATDRLVIAYEPIWAIGTGLVPTLEDIAAMHDHIRGVLSNLFDENTARNIAILYGGSVKPSNAAEILSLSDVNGALIGGASLKMDSLAAIAKSVQ